MLVVVSVPRGPKSRGHQLGSSTLPLGTTMALVSAPCVGPPQVDMPWPRASSGCEGADDYNRGSRPMSRREDIDSRQSASITTAQTAGPFPFRTDRTASLPKKNYEKAVRALVEFHIRDSQTELGRGRVQ